MDDRKGRGVPSRPVNGKGRLPVSQDRCVAFWGLDRRDWVRRALQLDQQSAGARWDGDVSSAVEIQFHSILSSTAVSPAAIFTLAWVSPPFI